MVVEYAVSLDKTRYSSEGGAAENKKARHTRGHRGPGESKCGGVRGGNHVYTYVCRYIHIVYIHTYIHKYMIYIVS